eukprot:CAMPEP_0113689176 /NCGR_PEP_ID=MMETSP0038_2-20120614/16991_1 /TAXON_ID=2898 /ORGANISM="Cryptomonas paramecium" /LENGTH=185 /DNA_ID=CAMNT_0000610163 /DNA_START=176 /DNA_END=729 /DNA_ORIENTATION=+ /assembly_acc=CAM_ASM_000170
MLDFTANNDKLNYQSNRARFESVNFDSSRDTLCTGKIPVFDSPGFSMQSSGPSYAAQLSIGSEITKSNDSGKVSYMQAIVLGNLPARQQADDVHKLCDEDLGQDFRSKRSRQGCSANRPTLQPLTDGLDRLQGSGHSSTQPPGLWPHPHEYAISYWPLHHAARHGAHPADASQPFQPGYARPHSA